MNKNESKAHEIADDLKDCVKDCIDTETIKLFVQTSAYAAAMKIVEWKESMMLAAMMEFVSEHFYNHPHSTNRVCTDDFTSVSDMMEKMEDFVKEYD